MIDSNELMRGNLVLMKEWRKTDLVQVEIDNIHETYVNLEIGYQCDNEWIYVDSLYPIPLTEEWLIKLGFEKYREENDFMLITYFTWNLKEKDEVYLLQYQDKFTHYLLPDDQWIESVHKLQNLVYLTSGIKLKIQT